jgi:hypothetical protein
MAQFIIHRIFHMGIGLMYMLRMIFANTVFLVLFIAAILIVIAFITGFYETSETPKLASPTISNHERTATEHDGGGLSKTDTGQSR